MRKLKVVWITYFSNETIRKHLHFDKKSLLGIYRTYFRKKQWYEGDFAQWNTNAIKEFENFNNIELHIIVPFYNLKYNNENFTYNNVHYHFFKPYDDKLIYSLKKKFFKKRERKYSNAQSALKIIENIDPEIIHLIGAENPFYSSIILELDNKRPILVSLQTLMCNKDFFRNYPINKQSYIYRSQIEKQVIQKADYIGTIVPKYQDIIWNEIKYNAKILNITLALAENIEKEVQFEKKYDFVYFALNINKACDYALKSFIIAHKTNPNITLNIVGSYDEEYKAYLDKLIDEANIHNSVSFTGKLPTHNDVIKQIRCSRFALLPLKIDIVSGTIREAIACGLPVITTITPGTPLLNEKRESVLLSPQEDFTLMAQNMLKLISNNELANTLKKNAIETLNEQYNNKDAMLRWVETYYAIHKFRKDGISIPEHLLAK